MRYLFVLAIGSLLLAPPVTAEAQPVTSVGNSPARSCFEAARMHRRDHGALDACNRAFQSRLSLPDTVATHVNRGVVHTYRGDHASALRDFDRAIDLNSDEPESFLNKGLLLLRAEGRQSDVLTLMNSAIQKNTRKPAVAYFARAMANERLGNLVAAYHDYKQAAALDQEWQLPAAQLRRLHVPG